MNNLCKTKGTVEEGAYPAVINPMRGSLANRDFFCELT